jgi:hypothetical protein
MTLSSQRITGRSLFNPVSSLSPLTERWARKPGIQKCSRPNSIWIANNDTISASSVGTPGIPPSGLISIIAGTNRKGPKLRWPMCR